MKQAILITAYRDFRHLTDLVCGFDDRFDLFIHIDRKSRVDEEVMRRLQACRQVKEVRQVFTVNWGGRHHVDAILWLCRRALEASPSARYFHLISGADQLLKPLDDFVGFFEAHPGRNFMEYFRLPHANWSGGGLGRLEFVHPLDRLNLREAWPYAVYLCANEDDEAKQPLPADQPLDIEIRDVSFSYTGNIGQPALSHVCFHIPAGKMTAIVGESGSGKTTLMKLLLKFYRPTEGQILWGGREAELFTAQSLRQACGIVMQDNFLFSDTVYRNIVLGEKEDKDRLESALHIACLDNYIQTHPLGLYTKVGLEGIGVSGGEKQRIMIARAVYKNPQYLLLDEATSSLDADNERRITEELATCFQGRTRIVIAHRLSTVKNADNIIVLHRGEMVESGTHSELVAKCGYYYNLIQNQLELADGN